MRESSVVAGLNEQTDPAELQQCVEAARLPEDLVRSGHGPDTLFVNGSLLSRLPERTEMDGDDPQVPLTRTQVKSLTFLG